MTDNEQEARPDRWWTASNGIEVKRDRYGEIVTHSITSGNVFHGNRGDAIAEWASREAPAATGEALAEAIHDLSYLGKQIPVGTARALAERLLAAFTITEKGADRD